MFSWHAGACKAYTNHRPLLSCMTVCMMLCLNADLWCTMQLTLLDLSCTMQLTLLVGSWLVTSHTDALWQTGRMDWCAAWYRSWPWPMHRLCHISLALTPVVFSLIHNGNGCHVACLWNTGHVAKICDLSPTHWHIATHSCAACDHWSHYMDKWRSCWRSLINILLLICKTKHNETKARFKVVFYATGQETDWAWALIYHTSLP